MIIKEVLKPVILVFLVFACLFAAIIGVSGCANDAATNSQQAENSPAANTQVISTQKPRVVPTPRPKPTSTPTPGEMIAVIDGEYGNSTYAKRGDYLTNSIASWCSDSVSPNDVGDLATVTSNVLQDQFGIEMTILEILEEVKDATDETEAGVSECKDFFVMYTFLRGQ